MSMYVTSSAGSRPKCPPCLGLGMGQELGMTSASPMWLSLSLLHPGVSIAGSWSQELGLGLNPDPPRQDILIARPDNWWFFVLFVIPDDNIR